mmetsp:Transcript_919/g.3434  ORF Transcript_919/g.3434 Transcript_919/m.3434 type:complete len:441 (-) Transcript_919:125-1447(-)
MGAGGEDSSAAVEAGQGTLEAAVRELLSALGENPDREGLRDTPQRVARALENATRGYRLSVADAVGGAVFIEPRAGRHGESAGATAATAEDLVVVGNIEVYSTSEADLRPFHGVCHIGYLPAGGRLLGLSKLARIAEVYARRLQTWDRLAADIAGGVAEAVGPAGVAVTLEVSHLSPGGTLAPQTATAALGAFAKSGKGAATEGVERGLWAAYEALLRLQRKRAASGGAGAGGAAMMVCPPCPPSGGEESEARVTGAAEALIRGVGENPEREGLRGAARGYARAMLSATAGSRLADVPGLEEDGDGEEETEEWVVEAELPVMSMCEHHLLPFHGSAHVAVFGAQRRLSRGRLARIVAAFSARLQVQERLTEQVARAVAEATGARGVAAALCAAHLCMLSRGVEKTASLTSSVSATGELKQSVLMQAQALERIERARGTQP